MDPISLKVLLSGSKQQSDSLYVDDLFSTFLFNGTRNTLQIQNGIDLAGEGGMVWSQVRDSSNNYGTIYDTENGTGPQGGRFFNGPQSTNGTGTQNDGLTSFNSDGYTLGGNLFENSNDATYGTEHVSWTFRKAPGFFDIVTYTGDGSNSRAINHNLGSIPGMIIIKSTSSSSWNWIVYHRSTGSSNKLRLNQNSAAVSENGNFGGLSPQATTFGVGYNATNELNTTYVAYIFAHDDAQFGAAGDESIIKCGSYTGTGGSYNMQSENASAPEIDLGFEPQWLLIKNTTSSSTDWWIFDTMRGFTANALGPHKFLHSNKNSSEGSLSTSYAYLKLTNKGFKITAGLGAYFNEQSNEYIYMAIRRPHKPPTAGTDVFTTGVNTQSVPEYVSNFVVDWAFHRNVAYSGSFESNTRVTGPFKLFLNSINSEVSHNNAPFDFMDGWGQNLANDPNYLSWMFRRAPGFLDVVAYSGHPTTPSQNVPHYLGVKPELMIVKDRNRQTNWIVYHKLLTGLQFTRLNTNGTPSTSGSLAWNNAEPTATHFTLGTNYWDTNFYTSNYVAFLFATLDGVSKVGSYTGTGYDIDVDCGFTNGARFVLIKRADQISQGDWYLWDSSRGIVSGNDPYVSTNNNNSPVTNTDYIDPLNSGFTVTSSGNYDLNQSGGTYIFLAIA